METNKFNFCPNCKTDKISTEMNERKWKCTKCNWTLYNNVASAVGLVIINNKGEVLLEKRAKEPRKGFLALPGGFVNPEETLEEAAKRECFEEIGAKVSSIKYIASFPNTYDYKNIRYKTCDVFFEATLYQDSKLEMQKNEVTEIVWAPCNTKEEIESIPLAFESAKKTLLTRIY